MKLSVYFSLAFLFCILSGWSLSTSVNITNNTKSGLDIELGKVKRVTPGETAEFKIPYLDAVYINVDDGKNTYIYGH